MSIGFDSQRSEAIRAGLVAEAAVRRNTWRPWRGLALVLAGVLAGTGATTAAFANGRVPATPPPSPGGAAEEQQHSSAGVSYVIVEDGGPLTLLDNDNGEEVGAEGLTSGRPVLYTVTVDGKNYRIHVEYQPTDDLREVGRAEFVLAEGTALDLSAHPSDASLAWVTFTCRTGGISVSGALLNDDEVGGGEDEGADSSANEDSAGRSAVTAQAMIRLDRPQRHIQPVDGCAAEVAVTYYSES